MQPSKTDLMRRRRELPPAGGSARSLSDEALLSVVALGDDDAIEEFVRRFDRRVYGAALAVVSDRALAQEVTQDAFVRVWRHAATYDPRRGGVSTWVLRITHNLCVDALRVRRPVAVDPAVLLGLEGESKPVTGADDAELVRRALRGLPRDQARAVLLAAMFGYSASTIAQLDGVPLGTAKTRIRLGLEKLRNELAVGLLDHEEKGDER
jgi:RNA polymerase sigma-70 factor (ECF subfamily)